MNNRDIVCGEMKVMAPSLEVVRTGNWTLPPSVALMKRSSKLEVRGLMVVTFGKTRTEPAPIASKVMSLFRLWEIVVTSGRVREAPPVTMMVPSSMSGRVMAVKLPATVFQPRRETWLSKNKIKPKSITSTSPSKLA